jgi:hypothetical protein
LELEAVDVDDSLGKCLRPLLGQIVPDAAVDHSMLVFAGEFLRIRARVRVGCAIGIALERDSGHRDDRSCGEPLFQIVVFCLALGEAEPLPVIVDHDTDVIGIVEGRSAALEGGIIELPSG